MSAGAAARRSGTQGDKFQDPRGEIVVQLRQGPVFAYQAIGHYTLPMVRFVFAEIEAYERGVNAPIHIFADFSQLRAYDSAVRIAATAWFRARGPRTARFHALINSKIVAMGVTTMGLIAGLPIDAYSDAKQFEKERRRYAATPVA